MINKIFTKCQILTTNLKTQSNEQIKIPLLKFLPCIYIEQNCTVLCNYQRGIQSYLTYTFTVWKSLSQRRIQGGSFGSLAPTFGFAPTRRRECKKIVFLHLFIPTTLPIRSNKGGMRKGSGCKKGGCEAVSHLGAKKFSRVLRARIHLFQILITPLRGIYIKAVFH